MPAGFPLVLLDADGSPLRSGDLVRILVVPDWLTHDLPIDEMSRLKALEGSTMRVLEIDVYGYLWFGAEEPWFSLRPNEVRLEAAAPPNAV
jgi:hypothetical protein